MHTALLDTPSRPRTSALKRRAIDRNGAPLLGTVQIDLEGTIRQVTPGLCAAFGYSEKQLEGAFFFAYVHAGDVGVSIREVVDLMHRRKRQSTWSFRFRKAEGQWCWVRAHTEVAEDDLAAGGLLLALLGAPVIR